MTKKEVLAITNKYFAYHRSNNKDIKTFKLINEVTTLSGRTVYGYGVYFNFDKSLYKFKGKYLYSCAITIKNPFITTDQVYSALITKEQKDYLTKKGYDSVVLVSLKEPKKIEEAICFKNSQIEIEQVTEQ